MRVRGGCIGLVLEGVRSIGRSSEGVWIGVWGLGWCWDGVGTVFGRGLGLYNGVFVVLVFLFGFFRYLLSKLIDFRWGRGRELSLRARRI